MLVVGSAAAVGAVGLAVWAFAAGPEVVLDVENAVAVETPSTVAPLETAPRAAATAPVEASPAASTTTTTTIPLSPLAEMLGPRGSAIPPEIEPRRQPVSLSIDSLDLEGPVRSVGLRTDGALEVPGASEIGWYRYGAAPGYEGATVLAAHVSWNGDIGLFHRLGDLDPGERVEITLEDGSQRTYEVTERTLYDKDELPA